MIVRHRLKLVALLVVIVPLLGLMIFGNPVSGDDKKQGRVYDSWTLRCDQDEAGKETSCEMFQRLVVKDTGQRVTELAIGFPPDMNGVARGVVVLPLGILLTEDMTMQIDEGQAFSFKPRYCIQDGCIAFLDLGEQVLNIMRKGSEAKLAFKVMNGQDVVVGLSLEGFSKGLKEIVQTAPSN